MFKRLWERYSEAALVGLALIFVAVITGFYFWGVNVMVSNLGRAASIESGGQSAKTAFDLEGARSLNLEL